MYESQNTNYRSFCKDRGFSEGILLNALNESKEYDSLDDSVHFLMSFLDENEIYADYDEVESVLFSYYCEDSIGTERMLKADTKDENIRVAFGYQDNKIITLIYDSNLYDKEEQKINDIYFLDKKEEEIGLSFFTDFSGLVNKLGVGHKRAVPENNSFDSFREYKRELKRDFDINFEKTDSSSGSEGSGGGTLEGDLEENSRIIEGYSKNLQRIIFVENYNIFRRIKTGFLNIKQHIENNNFLKNKEAVDPEQEGIKEERTLKRKRKGP
tara:strand:+ start:2062 stop:2868 length:807 start_codon:yes stop_codon:yes gene_type:complete